MRKLALLLALGLMPLVGVSPATLAADVVARVGGTDVTTDEVRSWLDTLPEADQAELAGDPSALSQLVRQYLLSRQVLRETKATKFDQRPEVKAKLDATRDAALAELYLQSVSTPPDGFPSEAEIKAAYEANKTAFVAPRQYRLAQIYVAGGPDDKAAKAKLDAVQKALKDKGADFGRVAAQLSDMKAEAEKGGEIGWIAERQLVPAIQGKVAGLPKDAISEPVRMDDGWHIVKLLDTKPAGTLPLADVKPSLIQRLRQAKAVQLRQAYLAKLLAQDPPVVNEMALSKLAPKPQ